MHDETKRERPPIEPGYVIGHRYRVLDHIGEGTMGTVFRVEHTEMGTVMAVKVIKDELLDTEGMQERFSREARAAATLDDPRIVRVTDFGRTEGDGLFMVMELVEGRPLNEYVDPSMPRRQVLALFDEILGALEHAHEQGIVHRDLKPQNIIVVKRREEPTVKILDFGLAKMMQGEGADDQLTQAFVVFGTPRYMSPEQAVGDPIDARTDLYAIGVVMYELFAGRRPFTADTIAGLLRKHVANAPPKLELDDEDGVRGYALERLILRAMAKDPDDRFASAAEFRSALLSVMAPAPAPVVERATSRLTSAARKTAANLSRRAQEARSRVTVAADQARRSIRSVAGRAMYGLPSGVSRAFGTLTAVTLVAAGAAGAMASAPTESAVVQRPTAVEATQKPSLDAMPVPSRRAVAVSSTTSEFDSQTAPVDVAEPSWQGLVQNALGVGELERGSHLVALWTLDTPDDPQAHLHKGHIAFRRGQFKTTIRAYESALALDPNVATEAELMANVGALAKRRHRGLLGFIKSLDRHGNESAADLLVELAKTARHPRERRQAYAGLERRGLDSRLDRRSYLTRNLRRNSTNNCELRRWYVQRLIELDDPRAAKTLQAELDRRTGFLKLTRTSRCMEDRIKRALAKWGRPRASGA